MSKGYAVIQNMKDLDRLKKEVVTMMNQLKKSCYEVFLSIGGYRLQEWTLKNQLKKEIRCLIREEKKAA